MVAARSCWLQRVSDVRTVFPSYLFVVGENTQFILPYITLPGMSYPFRSDEQSQDEERFRGGVALPALAAVCRVQQ